jgi:hypothetical protein
VVHFFRHQKNRIIIAKRGRGRGGKGSTEEKERERERGRKRRVICILVSNFCVPNFDVKNQKDPQIIQILGFRDQNMGIALSDF